MEYFFQCINCKSNYETEEMLYECPRCLHHEVRAMIVTVERSK